MKCIINNLEFEILKVERKNDNLIVEGTHRIGACHYDDCKIYLADYMSLQMLKNTLLHELSHAFISSHGLLGVNKFNQETVCEFVACHSESITKIANDYMDFIKQRINKAVIV